MLQKGEKISDERLEAKPGEFKQAFSLTLFAKEGEEERKVTFVEGHDDIVYLLENSEVVAQVSTDPLREFMVLMADQLQATSVEADKWKKRANQINRSHLDLSLVTANLVGVITDHKNDGATQNTDELVGQMMELLSAYARREQDRIERRMARDDGACECASCRAQRAAQAAGMSEGATVSYNAQLSEMLNGRSLDPEQWDQVRDLALQHGGVLGGDDLGVVGGPHGGSFIGFHDADKGKAFLDALKKFLSH